MRLVTARAFPHLCPGQGCVICTRIYRQRLGLEGTSATDQARPGDADGADDDRLRLRVPDHDAVAERGGGGVGGAPAVRAPADHPLRACARDGCGRSFRVVSAASWQVYCTRRCQQAAQHLRREAKL